MNKSVFMGRIGKDLVLGKTLNNESKLVFSIAVTKPVNGEIKTTWVPLVAYKKTAELIAQYFKKGERILVQAEFRSYSFDKQDDSGKTYVTEFVVSEFEFIEPRQRQTPVQQFHGGSQNDDYADYYGDAVGL